MLVSGAASSISAGHRLSSPLDEMRSNLQVKGRGDEHFAMFVGIANPNITYPPIPTTSPAGEGWCHCRGVRAAVTGKGYED